MNTVFQNWLDGGAIGASGLCLMHCLLIPFLIVLLPAMSAAAETAEVVHLISLFIIIPSSLVALSLGARSTRSYKLLLAGGLAIISLIFGALLEEIRILGASLTGIGSVLLIICHLRNWQQRTRIC